MPFFHPEPAVHFRICSFLVVCSSQSSQKLANTVRQLESHLLCEPRTWCWLRHGYTYVLPHTYCARLDPSLRNHVRMTTHTHTWKNACGAVACVSRACLLGARAPPPIAVSLWGFTELCAAKALMENLTVFSYPECGPTLDLGADKNACWGDSTYHRRLRASGRKKQQTELALLLYSVSIRCKHLRSY